MARDLFADTVASRPGPTRSKWTIAGSFFAHAAVVCAILIVPVLSATERLFIKDNIVLFAAPPPPVMPELPPPPAPAPVMPAPVTVNPTAAPAFPPEKPITEDAVPATATAGPVLPGSIATGGTLSSTAMTAGHQGISMMTPPPPKPPEVVRVGGDIKPPARIFYQPPVYPTIAQTARVEGTVTLEATIDESGTIRDLRVVRSIPLLDRAAIDAVSKWRYLPTRLNGTPVAVIMTVNVTFSLR
jgi:periplasmic protein TonB